MLLTTPETEIRLIEARDHADRLGLRDQLEKQLTHLAHFGCSAEESQHIRCRLCPDFAPYSSGFLLERLKEDGQYQPWFNGGLIFQGPEQPADGSFPSLTVSLHSQRGWFIHT